MLGVSEFAMQFMNRCFSDLSRHRSGTARLIVIGTLACGLIVLACWFFPQENTKDPESLHQQAMQAFADSDLSTMRSRIHALRLIPGEETRVDLLQGLLDLNLGMVEDAVRELNRAAGDQNFRKAALPLLGEALHRAGYHADAVRLLTQLLAEDESKIELRRWLAASYYDLGATDLAMAQMSKIAEQDPRDPRPHRLRGLIQKDFEQFKEAIPEYEESLRRDPKQHDRQQILLELAECQLKMHELASASRTLSGAEPTADCLILKARCAREAGDPTLAASLANEVLRSDPDHPAALVLSAQELLESDRSEDALALLERAAKLQPRDYETRYLLATAYNRTGRSAEATAEMTEVERIQKLLTEFTSLHQAAFADTTDAELRIRLGKVAGELNRPELARIWFQAALAIDPLNEDASRSLAELRTVPDSSSQQRSPGTAH